MSLSLSSSQPAWQSRPGQNYPAFPGSRVVPAMKLNSHSAVPPKLTKKTLESVAGWCFWRFRHHQSHRQRDHKLTDLLLQPHGDSTGASYCSSLDNRLGCSYDHTGIRIALPTPAKASTSRLWFQVAASSSRLTSSKREYGSTPSGHDQWMEQRGCQCWTDLISAGARGAQRSNPWHYNKPNVNFQRDLNLMIEVDRDTAK